MDKKQKIGGKITVGEFFQQYEVCIPILQRDYAQGREGKAHIREAILKEISAAVTDGKNITMDFIYGYKKDGVFYPLDGQQRLTTLWLVYWYLAVKADAIEGEKAGLLNFTYKTRKSSREFCKALCNEAFNKRVTNIVQYIQEQTWFLAAWKKDPTISAMLRMLGGTNGKDGIEPVFGGKRKYSDKLEAFKNNISFYVLDIGSEQLPREKADQLYVKMNARGKALTDFENFKADFIRACPGDNDLARKMDNEWSDLFWKAVAAGEDDGKTDEVFFTFINRFCANQLFLQESFKPELVKKIDEILEEESAGNSNDLPDKTVSKKLVDIPDEQKSSLRRYDYFIQDTKIKYTKFDYYADLKTPNVEKLRNILDRLAENCDSLNRCINTIVNRVVQKREKADYRFLPDYKRVGDTKQTEKDENGNDIGVVVETSYKERAYFFAVCKFFEKNDYNETAFSDWLRFCRNIIENSGIDAIATMVSVIRKLDEWGEHSNRILSYLSEQDPDDIIPENKWLTQFREEARKAALMKQDTAWSGAIREAEDTLFLCGKIGFLLYCGSDPDLDSFKGRFARFKEFFKNGSASDDFVRNFAKSYEDFDHVKEKLIFHNKGWQARGDSWLDVLSEPENNDRVFRALSGETFNDATGDYKSFVESNAFLQAVKKEGVFASEKDLRIAWFRNCYALYKKYRQQNKLLFDYESKKYLFKRNCKLYELQSAGKITIDDKQVLAEEDCAYYYGDEVSFSFNGAEYLWSSDDKIYLIIKDGKSKSILRWASSELNCNSIYEKLSS